MRQNKDFFIKRFPSLSWHGTGAPNILSFYIFGDAPCQHPLVLTLVL